MPTGEHTDYQEIRYEIENGRARITLNRADKHNAMNPQLLEELEHALWEADDDMDVHCVILRGDGPSFCSGYDLTALGGKKRPGYRTGRSHDDDIWLIERNNRQIRALWDMHKPSIAQVHGNCLAGGTDLVAFLDVAVASEEGGANIVFLKVEDHAFQAAREFQQFTGHRLFQAIDSGNTVTHGEHRPCICDADVGFIVLDLILEDRADLFCTDFHKPSFYLRLCNGN